MLFRSDLYVHDTQTGKTQRITSLEWAKSVEAPERIDRFVKKEAQKIKEEAERQAQVAAKADHDPAGLLNPGKLRGWLEREGSPAPGT